MHKTCAIILAAGDGKRMKSASPKVLCEVLFTPLISWVVKSPIGAGIEQCCVVVSESNQTAVSAHLPKHFNTAVQHEKLGTGHAAYMAADFIRAGGYTDVLVLYGDAPFFTSGDLTGGYELHKQRGNLVTAYSAVVEKPFGFGRIVREGEALKAVVEERDADEATKLINEVNVGTYWFDAGFLLNFFENMSCNNAQQEYYLTDAIEYAVQGKKNAGVFAVEPSHFLAANNRAELAVLNEFARRKVIEKHLENGVNIPFLDGIIIGPDVEIAADTLILPGTILKGSTKIGECCEIGPNTQITDAVIGNSCLIQSSFIADSTVCNNAKIGPFCNIRPGCVVEDGAKIGDFVELKNSVIGANTSVAHLTYIGDSDVGSGCNFGCGVVTANYDGKNKHRTVIGDDCFIGCNCNLVPPLTLGDRAYAATGTTITEDVPSDALVIGRVRQEIKENWAKESGLYQKKQK